MTSYDNRYLRRHFLRRWWDKHVRMRWWRIEAKWRKITNLPDLLNRTAEVEQWLYDIADSRRPLPTPNECRRMARKLGIPRKYRSETDDPKESRH